MTRLVQGAAQPELRSRLPAETDRPSGDETASETMVIHAHAYSGCDIKLVAHLPPEEMEEPREIREMREALNDLEGRLDNVSTEAERREVVNEIWETATALEAAIEEMSSSRGANTRTLAEIQTLSITAHREKSQVRRLGAVYPASITRGMRTIAGSMVFAVFHEHVFSEFFRNQNYRSTGVGDWDHYAWSTFMTDQLPPMDISIVFANEYGNMSWSALLGVEFVNEGMVMSIEDLFIEGTAQYIARDWDPIRNVANRQLTRQSGVGGTLTGTSLLMRDLESRVRGRRNPFL